MEHHNQHKRLLKRLVGFSPTIVDEPAPTQTESGVSAVVPPVAVTPTTSSAPATTPDPVQQSTTQPSTTPNVVTPTSSSSVVVDVLTSSTPVTSSTEAVLSSSSIVSSTTPATSSSATPVQVSTTPRTSPAPAATSPAAVTTRASSAAPSVKAFTNASGNVIYSTLITSAPETTSSAAPTTPSNAGTIVGAVAGALVGVVVLIAFVSWIVRQYNKRKQGNNDDFDRQSYLRNSMMIPDEEPGAGRPVIGTQAALALARANTVGPRPPTMIERKPTYLMNGQPSPSYGPGQVVSFEPGQIVSAPPTGNGYPSPMQFSGYTPPDDHHQSELSRRPSGAQLLTRQPTNGGMYNNGYQQTSPVNYSPDGYHPQDGFTYPMHTPMGERGMIQSVTPYQAQQYAEITRQLEGHPSDFGNQSFLPISPVAEHSPLSPVGYAVSSEETKTAPVGSPHTEEKNLPNPFDEKVNTRIDSTPPSLPPLGIAEGLSRTGTPIDPNPQHAHWSYDAKAGQPGSRLSVAGMPMPAADGPTIPAAAYTREERTVVVGNGEAMHATAKRPVSIVDEDDVYGGM